MAASSPTHLPGPPPPAGARASARRRRRRPAVASALLLALVGAAGYACFADGAVGLPQETRLQVAIAVLAAIAAAAWLGARRVRPAASPYALAGLVALLALAVWSGASLLWTVAPAETWREINRLIAYTLVVAVALGCASAAPRAVARVAGAWLVVAAAVALWALAGKALPGVFEDTLGVARLRAPLEYWNALAMICVLGVPVAVRLAEDRARRTAVRVASLLGLVLLLACLALTYSRGGLLALAVALVVLVVAGPGRLRVLATFALGALAAGPALAFAFAFDALSDSGVARGDRIDAGLIFGGVLLLTLVLVGVLAARFLVRLERRIGWSEARSRRTGWALAAVAVALLAGGVAVVAVSDDGLGGTVEEAVDTFTETRADKVDDPDRLLSVSSGNRWAWWQEGFGAFADEPVLGWGAGSFPVSRRLYRVSGYDVLEAHDLPVQLLAEVGVVGAVLGLGALALLTAAAVGRVRRRRDPERDLAAALLAAVAAYLVHGLVDWDWDIPAVTVPVLIFLGVLGARAARERPALLAVEDSGRPGRVAALAATALLLGAVVVSAVLPAWSDGLTSDALERASKGPESRLEGAAADAERAARLDPLAVRPLLAAASIAEGRRRPLEARDHLLDAVERDPYSLAAWTRLARLAVTLADRRGAQRASRELLELDPGDDGVRELVRSLQAVAAPPEGSPTATGTPLPPAGGSPAATPGLGSATPSITPVPEPGTTTTPATPGGP
jgi:hypothetical protein